MPRGPGKGGARGSGYGGKTGSGLSRQSSSAQQLRGPGSSDVDGPVGATPGLTRTITGAVNNGAGLIRITTSAAHGFDTGQQVTVSGVGGTVEANAPQAWQIIKVSATTFDLAGSTFTNVYTSGGTATRQ
jgi:hypothetical protein